MKGQDAIDAINTDKWLDGYFDEIGLPPDSITPQQIRDQNRKVRQQQQAAMQQGQAMLAATEGAKNLGGAKADPSTILGQLLGPQAAAQGGEQ